MNRITRKSMEMLTEEIIDAIESAEDRNMQADMLRAILEGNGIVEIIETDFAQEVYRAYDVLGEQAEMQNRTDIKSWLNNGWISETNAIELNRLNYQLYIDFCK